MKGFGKIGALGLAIVLCWGLLAVPAAAADEGEMLQVLAVLSVMNGDENGDLALDRNVSRAEFAKMCVAASGQTGLEGQPAGTSAFPDVPAGHWAAGYIAAACQSGWLMGDLEGTFRPNDGITLAEAATVALRMLGYTDQDFTARWPVSQMALCRELELDGHIAAGQDDPLTRRECGWLIYNTLSAPCKTGTVYAAQLGYALDAQGELDSLGLLSEKLEGPLVASAAWRDEIGFAPRQVYLNGQAATAADILPYTVLYLQEEAGLLFAYSTRHTGTITAISPSAAQPQSVTVGGVTYSLGSAQAARSLSDQGQFRVGDVVTLLMGREDQVAAVIAADAMDDTLYGVVAAAGRTAYPDAQGGQHMSDYVDVIAADGQTYRVPTPDDRLEAGDLVSVNYGRASAVSRLKEVSLSGKVSADAIGASPLSPDAELLDVWENAGISVPVSRLEGCTLSASDVRFVSYDGAGRISCLILDDFTGDLHQYGVLTAEETVPTGVMSFLSTYTCVVAGSESVFTTDGVSFPVSTGGVQLRFLNGVLDRMYNLEQVTADSAGETWIAAGSRRYTLSDTAQVYLRRDGDYYLTTWSAVRDTDSYRLTAWYDAADSQGGRVRVVVAAAR